MIATIERGLMDMRTDRVVSVIFAAVGFSILLGAGNTWAQGENVTALPCETLSPEANKGYAGLPACARCHIEEYNEHRASGRPKKLRPASEAAVSIRVQCSTCHASQAKDFSGSTMQRPGITCNDCHMPPAGKSAETFRKYVGDVKSRITKISTGPEDKMFTDDGEFATGKLTLDFTFLYYGGRDISWARVNVRGIHSRGK
jgi:hypothetical protein